VVGGALKIFEIINQKSLMEDLQMTGKHFRCQMKKEVNAMKRFVIPRVAHCSQGCCR